MEAAQAKANDMVTRNYWSHNYTPDGPDALVVHEYAGYRFQGSQVKILPMDLILASGLFPGWMSSPEHKANILNEDFNPELVLE